MAALAADLGVGRTMTDRATLVSAWIEEYSRHGKASYDSPSALDELRDMTHRDPAATWDVTLALIQAATDDRVLAGIAAGPLEDLIRRSHAMLLELVDTAARRDPTFRRCLTGVWLGDDTPAHVRDCVTKYTSTVKDGFR